MTELTCRRCRSPLEARAGDGNADIAICADCNTVLDLRASVPDFTGRREREPPPLPEGVKLDRALATFSTSWRWYSSSTPFLTLACIGGLAVSLFHLRESGPATSWLAFLPLGVLAPLYFVLCYTALAQWLNRTHVSVEGRKLRIAHRPLPWRGGGEWEAAQFDHLYCRRRLVQNGQISTREFDLMAQRRDGRILMLLKGLDSPEKVLWLEQELTRILDLPEGRLERASTRGGAVSPRD